MVVRKLTAAAVLAVAAAVAGCGGDSDDSASKRDKAYRQFQSRPDLQVPRVLFAKTGRRAGGEYLFVAPKKAGKPGGPLILDTRGRTIWFHEVRKPAHAADFRVQRYRGRPVLTWWEGTQPTIGIGVGKFVIRDASYRPVAELRAGNGLDGDLHEFLITKRDTALVIAYERVRHDLTSVGGPKTGWAWDNVVQELELPSGRVLFQWRSLEHVPVAESAQRAPAAKASKKVPFDYFHANSVAVDSDGNLLVSARNTSAIYKISRRDGRVLWRLGGRRSDFALGPGVKFAWQHDARRLPDGTLSLFDNSAIPKVADHSRALVVALDLGAKQARLVRAYVHPRRLLAPHQGNMQRLPNGHFVVGWGGKPYITEFDASGRVLLDARLAIGDTYRAYRFAWTGRPTGRPAATVDDDVVYASWNGATEVARWEVLAGDDRDGLERVATAPWNGLETAIRLDSGGDYVAVRAVDSSGEVLGTSRTLER